MRVTLDKDLLRKEAFEMGISLFGIADITGIRKEFKLDGKLLAALPRAISLGKRLITAVLEGIEDRPTPLYFHHYRQVNNFLDRTALLLASRIQEAGFKALPIPASQIIDWEKQQGHLSHKKVGYLAGLGWMGRNNLLVNPDFGAQIRLVTVLTDMPLEPDRPLEMNCGGCIRCLSACPAGAIKKTREEFDHQSCFEKLKEFRRLHIVSQFICGICVKACGPERRAQNDFP